MNKRTREPLFHITKRAALPWWAVWAIRGGALLAALIVCGVITSLVTGENPFQVYAAIYKGSFGTARKLWVLLQNIAMLLCVSLAVTPAFRMRCWNLGGEGQALAGALAAAACMICLRDKLPNGAVILLMIVTSILAGAIWAGIPAFFKARFNTNETLFTLMMNYVATQLVAYYCVVWESPKGSGNIGIINPNTQIGWFPQIGSYKYLLNIIVVAVVCLGMYVYLNYSKHGYELAVVGESERTARYVGIKVDRVINRRGPRLHGRHGLVAGQVQPDLDDPHELPAGLPRPRRQRDRDQVLAQLELRRHPDGHHPVLHHRQRVLHQLSAEIPPQRRKGGQVSNV